MQIDAKVVALNTSDGLFNVSVIDEEGTLWNIKANQDEVFLIGHVYRFVVQKVIKERISYVLENYQKLNFLDMKEQNTLLRKFYPGSPISLEESQRIINDFISQIQNEVIHRITAKVVEDNQDKFYIYPAASRMHHAYVGGLAYHTIGMLKLAKSFIENYPYLKSDYIYSGIILHDLGKTKELTGVEGTEYTVDGQLLGHLVMGALEVNRVAIEFGYSNCNEVRNLLHMLISHHGQPQFGAAKRPMTPEAIALWYIDTIDSKFRVLGEELEKTEGEHFTDTIGVLDKVKVYKE